jgi:hypothetical protein
MCRVFGSKKTYHSINHWKCKAAKRVLQIVRVREEEEKKYAEMRLQALIRKKEIPSTPKPERRNFRNFRSWADAVNRWLPIKIVCADHYREKWEKHFDFDKQMWTGKYRYGYTYPEVKVDELEADLPCSVKGCGFVFKALKKVSMDQNLQR